MKDWFSTLSEQVPGQTCTTTKQYGLYHGYDELRKDLYDAYNQKEISFGVTNHL